MRIDLSELQPAREPQPLIYADVTARDGAIFLSFFTPKDGGDVYQYGLILGRSYAKALGLALCDEYLKALKQGMEESE